MAEVVKIWMALSLDLQYPNNTLVHTVFSFLMNKYPVLRLGHLISAWPFLWCWISSRFVLLTKVNRLIFLTYCFGHSTYSYRPPHLLLCFMLKSDLWKPLMGNKGSISCHISSGILCSTQDTWSRSDLVNLMVPWNPLNPGQEVFIKVI